MKVYYDLHIHSCLSPCGDEDMTPNNIVNMARLAGLDMIALTDHNSCKNCPAILKVAERAGIVALAGMELCTAEECHVVCLFPDIGAAMEFDAMVEKTLPPIRNRPDAFGEQVIMDDGDKAAGSYETLLITASSISIDDVARIVGEYRGIALPAHIDRPSYSVISALGTVPEAGFRAFEVSREGDPDRLAGVYPALRGHPILCNSDAHELCRIQQAEPWLELNCARPEALIEALNGNLKGWGRKKHK